MIRHCLARTMFALLVCVLLCGAEGITIKEQKDPVTDQLVIFKENNEGPIGVLTTSAGAPVAYEDATNTLNTPLMDNSYYMDALILLGVERTPERLVHAQGTGAFGYFQVTKDITRICKADFLKKVGLKTPVAVRFSTSSGSRGCPEFVSDVRGFAIKFYTHEGNLDLIGFNTPMYFFNDPLHFLPLVHTSRGNPATNVLDENMSWDFLTSIPEAMLVEMLTLAGRGRPASYKNMPCFPIHTFQLVNDRGEYHFVKFHIMPDAGIKNLSTDQARNFSIYDPNYLTKDLFRAIGNGDFPRWTVGVQIMTEDDIKAMGSKAFDVTRTISLEQYPIHEVGKLVLDRNAKNFYAEIEQLAFCPGNLVPGFLGSPDKLFQARRVFYRDSQLHRLGSNFNKILVNCPFRAKTYTYTRDGTPPVKDNGGDAPNYYPNSFHGPIPYMPLHKSRLIEIIEKKAYNFDQASEVYENELTTEERTELIQNMAYSLVTVDKCLEEKAIRMLKTINRDLGLRVELYLNLTKYSKT